MQIALDGRLVLTQLGLDFERFELWSGRQRPAAITEQDDDSPLTPDPYIGKTVTHDIFSANGLLLIPANTVLTKGHIQMLNRHKVTELHVVESRKQTAVDSLIEEASRYTEDLFGRIRVNSRIPMLEVRSRLIPLILEATEHDDLFEIIEAVRSKDAYTYKHSIGVGVLSCLVGRWMRLDSSDQALLATAATLHDVGKMKVPQELLHKPGRLTPEEYVEMKRHTVYGYEMLRDTPGLNPRIAMAALQHHERADGSGYPLGLHGQQIDAISRIVAVADVFHAMTSDRPYQNGQPFHEVFDQLRHAAFHGLDPRVVRVMLEHVSRQMIGKRVVLTDGRQAEVVYMNPMDETRPLVKVKHSFLDLSIERHIRISSVIA